MMTAIVVMTVTVALGDVDAIGTDANSQATALMLAVMMVVAVVHAVAVIAIASLGGRGIHADGEYSR